MLKEIVNNAIQIEILKKIELHCYSVKLKKRNKIIICRTMTIRVYFRTKFNTSL